MRQCQKDSSGGFGILHLFWRSPLFISSPVSTVDEENPRDVASSMANGAIRRDPIAVKAGAISKQDRSARYAVLGTRCPRALLYQRGGGLEGRGGRRWGEMSPRLGVGVAPNFPSSNPTPRTATTPSQDGAVDVPTTPSMVAFPAFPERMAQADPSFRPPSILPRTPGIHPRKLKSRPRCGG